MALTLSQIRQLPGYQDASDDELINHAQSLGIKVNGLENKPAPEQPEEAGALRSYVGIPFEKGVSDIGSSVGYGLDALGAHDAGRYLQESNKRVQDTLTARQSQQARDDAQKTLIDDNGNWGGYNFGTLAQDLSGSVPATIAMGMSGAPLAKVATGVSKALGIGEKVAAKVAQVASTGPLGKGLAEGLSAKIVDTTVGSAVGFGASEGLFSGASNAAQLQTEIRHTDLNKLAEHPVFQEVLNKETDPSHPMEERMYQAREIIARKAGNDTFADTLVKTGLISMATGGGMFGIIRGNAAKKAAGEAVDGVLTRAAKGFVSEGLLQEAPQSALEQRTMNQAKQDYTDQHQDLNQGVKNAGLQGGLAGGVMGMLGAGSGGTHSDGNQAPPSEKDQPPANQLALPAPTRPTVEGGNDRAPSGDTIVYHDGSQINADQRFYDLIDHGGLTPEQARRQVYMELNGKPKPVIGIPELVFTADGTSLNKTDLVRGFTANGASEQDAHDYIKRITQTPIAERTAVNLDPYRFMQDRNAQLMRDAEGIKERAAIQNEQNANDTGVDNSIPTESKTKLQPSSQPSWEEADLLNEHKDQSEPSELRKKLRNARDASVVKPTEEKTTETRQTNQAPSFVATHNLSDGTPVTKVEGNVYADAQGNEFEDNYAQPITEAASANHPNRSDAENNQGSAIQNQGVGTAVGRNAIPTNDGVVNPAAGGVTGNAAGQPNPDSIGINPVDRGALDKTERKLKMTLTRSRNKLKSFQGSLEDKLKLKDEVKQAEKNLHDFRLNYFSNEDAQNDATRTNTINSNEQKPIDRPISNQPGNRNDQSKNTTAQEAATKETVANEPAKQQADQNSSVRLDTRANQGGNEAQAGTGQGRSSLPDTEKANAEEDVNKSFTTEPVKQPSNTQATNDAGSSENLASKSNKPTSTYKQQKESSYGADQKQLDNAPYQPPKEQGSWDEKIAKAKQDIFDHLERARILAEDQQAVNEAPKTAQVESDVHKNPENVNTSKQQDSPTKQQLTESDISPQFMVETMIEIDDGEGNKAKTPAAELLAHVREKIKAYEGFINCVRG